MKESEKDQIRALRMKGYGYRSIATMLHMALGSVKQYCKCHGLGGYGPVVKYNAQLYPERIRRKKCPVCGSMFESAVTGRTKKYCSDRCRYEYHNKNKKAIKPE